MGNNIFHIYAQAVYKLAMRNIEQRFTDCSMKIITKICPRTRKKAGAAGRK
jgi:hypothetical protein